MSSNRAPKSGFAAEAQRKVTKFLPKNKTNIILYACMCMCVWLLSCNAFIWAFETELRLFSRAKIQAKNGLRDDLIPNLQFALISHL